MQKIDLLLDIFEQNSGAYNPKESQYLQEFLLFCDCIPVEGQKTILIPDSDLRRFYRKYIFFRTNGVVKPTRTLLYNLERYGIECKRDESGKYIRYYRINKNNKLDKINVETDLEKQIKERFNVVS